MTKNIDKLKDSIASLLDKASDKAATEAEADQAMSMAMKMADKYGLSLAELKKAKRDKVDFELRTFKSSLDADRIHVVDEFLSVTIAKFCNCRVWVAQNHHVSFLGLAADVELAVYLRESLKRTMIYNYHVYINNVHEGSKVGARISFMTGFARVLIDRLTVLLDTSRAQGDGTAIAIRKMSLVDSEMAARGLNLHSRSGGTNPSSKNSDANAAGKWSGGNADIGRGVGGNAQARIGN